MTAMLFCDPSKVVSITFPWKHSLHCEPQFCREIVEMILEEKLLLCSSEYLQPKEVACPKDTNVAMNACEVFVATKEAVAWNSVKFKKAQNFSACYDISSIVFILEWYQFLGQICTCGALVQQCSSLQNGRWCHVLNFSATKQFEKKQKNVYRLEVET